MVVVPRCGILYLDFAYEFWNWRLKRRWMIEIIRRCDLNVCIFERERERERLSASERRARMTEVIHRWPHKIIGFGDGGGGRRLRAQVNFIRNAQWILRGDGPIFATATANRIGGARPAVANSVQILLWFFFLMWIYWRINGDVARFLCNIISRIFWFSVSRRRVLADPRWWPLPRPL